MVKGLEHARVGDSLLQAPIFSGYVNISPSSAINEVNLFDFFFKSQVDNYHGSMEAAKF